MTNENFNSFLMEKIVSNPSWKDHDTGIYHQKVIRGGVDGLALYADLEQGTIYAKFDWSDCYEEGEQPLLIEIGASVSQLRENTLELKYRHDTLGTNKEPSCSFGLPGNKYEPPPKQEEISPPKLVLAPAKSPVESMKEFAAAILRKHLATHEERPDWKIKVMVDLESGPKWYQADPEMPEIAHEAGRLLRDIASYQREPISPLKKSWS